MLRWRSGPKAVREGSLAVAAIAAGALMLAPPASAEPAKAGRFVQQGMAAMWDIGLLLPFDRAATIKIRSCDLKLRQATCQLAVTVEGHPRCTVTVLLRKRQYGFPVDRWRCPQTWRPVYYTPTRPGVLMLQKAVR
jgi:hypothetical protein